MAQCSSSSQPWVRRKSERCFVIVIGVLKGAEEFVALLFLRDPLVNER
jgi:hypothetical protein